MFRSVLLFVFCIILHACQVAPSEGPTALLVEYADRPLGLDVKQPRFAWYPMIQNAGIEQNAYQIQVAQSEDDLLAGVDLVWDSERVTSKQHNHVQYAGESLSSRSRYYWRVRVWDDQENASVWSDPSWWEMGLLEEADWGSTWIGGRQEVDHNWYDLKVSYTFTITGIPVPPAPQNSFFGNPAPVETNDFVPLAFLFRAQPIGKTYGDTYFWQIASAGGQPLLRAKSRRYPGHSSVNGSTEMVTLEEIPLDMSLEELVGQQHTIEIEAKGTEIRTWFNGELIDVRTDERHSSGTIGFNSEEPGAAIVHSVAVESEETAPFFTDFSGQHNPFTAGRPTSNGLLVNGGITGRGSDKDIVLPISSPAPLLRKSFEAQGDVERARLYVAAGGWPMISLNGKSVNKSAIENGFTAYDRRILYRTYDVTDALQQGTNALGIELGRGWFGVTVPNEWYWQMSAWHGQPRVLVQLEIEYKNGVQAVVHSDGSWRAIDGPTLDDSMYLGEKYDARLLPPNWNTAGFDDDGWPSAVSYEAPSGQLVAANLEPVEPVSSIDPLHITEPEPGVFVFDFGRIFAGWVELHVSGETGQTVGLVHTEQLDTTTGLVAPHGGLIDGQLQTDYYTLSGEGTEVWEPQFGYKGFRYVQLSGFPGTPTRETLKGKVVHSSVSSTASFESSNELVNKIQQAARNTLLNNTHGFITDTPTFEKNGWTGDAHASSYANMLNFDMARVITKWMADFRDAQSEKGEVPEIVPSTRLYGYENTPGWNMIGGPVPSWDAATIVIPWDVYEQTGDTRLLSEMYETQKRLVDYTGTYINQDNGYIYRTANLFLGEYAASGPTGPVDATAVAYFYHMTATLAETAALLGNQADAELYNNRAEAIRKAYNSRYWHAEGQYYRSMDQAGSEEPYAQTQNVLPLAFGMAPEGSEEAIMHRLNEDLIAREYHLSAGIFATRYLMNMLSDYGYTDTAYQVATQTDEPSWGWWIENDNMTMFEGWSLNSRSRDHHYYASISTWFIESLGGIRPAAPGYEGILIKPHVPQGLQSVSTSLETVQGMIHSAWTQDEDGRFELEVKLPGTVPTEVWVPAALPPSSDVSGFVRMEEGYAVYELGEGTHRLVSELL